MSRTRTRHRDREGILENLEGLSFVDVLSSRFEIPPRLVVYGMGGIAAVLIAVFLWMTLFAGGDPAEEVIEPQSQSSSSLQQSPTEFATEASTPIAETQVASTSKTIVVYVTGALESPGLYTLPGSSRVGDAVLAAGGLTADAAVAVVNLAEQASDGMHIHIPRIDEVEKDEPATGTVLPGSSASSTAEAPGLVNINTADSATLQTLTGIGPATAQKIIDYRTAHGPFGSKEEIKQVSGIGEKKYAAIEARITV